MKKMILLSTLFVGFIFSQTGMLTPVDESGMGIWINHGLLQIDNDDYEGELEVGFDYMTGIGVNVGIDLGEDWKGLEFGYHYKSEKWNASVSWERQMMDDFDVDIDALWFMAYCDTALYGGLGGASFDGSDWEFETLKFGKLWTFDMGMTMGVSYEAICDDIDKGVISVDLGYNF